MKLEFAENRPFDVIALGRVGVDMYANDLNCPMEEIKSFSKYIGGSPANIAMGTAKLGLKTGFIGKIAPDSFGRYIIQHFQQQDIDTRGIVYDKTGANTQIAVSEILSPEKSNVIFYRDNVADLNLEPCDISEGYVASAKILMLSGTALSGSPSREAVFVAIEYALKHDVRIMMDIDYRPFTWKSKEEMAVYYNLACEKCDIILGTREEFDVIEGIVSPGNKDDQKSADRLFGKAAKVIVVKHGKEGSYGFSADGGRYEGVIYPAKVVNTFGAGDSYAASFISGLLDGCRVDECMKRGAAASSIVISKNDCSDAMPTRAERDDYMATHEAVRG
ncbi:MAG: 5-dehydro-2-deoxygluconokinase [Eubacteriales bacterium]|nr:5-dehydro-2-deoxygluconokinase [Eubacteriales bacterium]